MTDSDLSLPANGGSDGLLSQVREIGGCRIIKYLGGGGFGRVYLAKDLVNNDRLVAIKVLKLDDVDRNEQVQVKSWFNREATILMLLQHDHIVHFRGYDIRSNPYIIMDYVPGKNLDDMLEEAGGHLEWQQVIQWGLVLCDVLTYLHQQNPPFVFRDMKLSNVVIDSTTNSPTVVDFGLARQHVASGNTIIGTPGYMPYEQWIGEAEPRSDIYALGATMHALLTGCRPTDTFHQLRTVLGSAEKVMRNLFAPIDSLVPNVPASLVQVIAKATAFKPEDRFPTSAAMAEALRNVLRQHPDGVNLVVAADGTGHYTSINQAIQHAHVGARIEVNPGVYDEEVFIDRDVELVAMGPVGEVVIESTDGRCIVMVTDHASVQGMTLRCRAGMSYGGAMVAVDVPRGQLELDHCVMTSDAAACVAIHGDRADPILRDCHIDGGPVGIWFFDAGKGTVERCHIVNSQREGIVITGGSDPYIRDCVIRNGKDDGIYVHANGQGNIDNCTITGNALVGVRIADGGDPTIRRCKVRHGSSNGVWVCTDGYGFIESCDIYKNAGSGIVISERGTPVVRQCAIHENGQAGVFCYESGGGTVEDCRVFSNALAGVEVRETGNLQINRAEIRDGLQDGIYIHNEGIANITDCNIYGNHGPGISIANNGHATARGCEIHEGSDTGVLIVSSDATLEACRVWGHESVGVKVAADSSPTIRESRIHENKDWGVWFESARGRLEGCEVWGHGRAEVYITADADPVIANCRIHDGLKVGVRVEDADGTIDGCEIYGHSLSGITLSRQHHKSIDNSQLATELRPSIRRCQVSNCGDAGIYAFAQGEGTLTDCEFFENRSAEVKITTQSTLNLHCCTLRNGRGDGLFLHGDGRGTISDCDMFGNALSGVKIGGDSDPLIAGCRIHTNQQSGILVEDSGRGIVRDSEVRGNTLDGITISAQANPQIQNCTIADGKACGIRVVDGGRGTIDNCQIAGNALAGVDISEHGNPLVTRCDVRNGAAQGVRVHDRGYGIIHECDIVSNLEAGIEITQFANPLVRKCHVSLNTSAAIRIQGQGAGLVEDCYIASTQDPWDIDEPCLAHRWHTGSVRAALGIKLLNIFADAMQGLQQPLQKTLQQFCPYWDDASKRPTIMR